MGPILSRKCLEVLGQLGSQLCMACFAKFMIFEYSMSSPPQKLKFGLFSKKVYDLICGVCYKTPAWAVVQGQGMGRGTGPGVGLPG